MGLRNEKENFQEMFTQKEMSAYYYNFLQGKKKKRQERFFMSPTKMCKGKELSNVSCTHQWTAASGATETRKLFYLVCGDVRRR